MKTILIVCTGTVCRSPMAEVLLQHMTRDKSDLRVMSAGLAHWTACPRTGIRGRIASAPNCGVMREIWQFNGQPPGP